jgi:hypothetical protein
MCDVKYGALKYAIIIIIITILCIIKVKVKFALELATKVQIYNI